MKRRKIPDQVAAMLQEAERQAAAASGMPPGVAADAIGEMRQLQQPWHAKDEPPDNATLAWHPLTDLGNAERCAARFKDRLKYVAAVGWLWWDGQRWSREGADEKIQRAAHETARAIQDEAAAIRGTDADTAFETKRDGKVVHHSDRLASWGRASESAQKLSAIAKHAAPYLSVDAGELDADPWAINVLNGTIIIRHDAGDDDPIRFVPHDPDRLITKLAPVFYDPAARCERYDSFLAEVQPAPEMRRFLHAWAGYSATGSIEEQKLCFFYGKGRNGKSTLVDTWSTVFGDYGETVPIETFVDQGRGRNAGAATPDLAILPGIRFLRTSEPEKNAQLAESLIKLTTGGEPIQARHLNRDYFKFRPAFKLTMSGNYRPKISGTDEGIWRRVILVPWPVTVEKPEPHLLERLAGEASGILNRILDGLRDYLDNGLQLPAAVKQATQDYREDSDPLGRFLAECVATSPGDRVAARRMHEVYSAWAHAYGEHIWKPKGLSQALQERGFFSIRSNGKFWNNVRLSRSEIDFGASSAPRTPDDGDDE